MRVLVAHSAYLSGPASGENRVAADEVRLLRDAGHEVWSWTPSVEDHRPAQLALAGARTVWSRPAAREVRTLIDRHGIEILHLHNLFPALSPAVIRAARAASVPVVQTLHNYRLLCLAATFLRDGRTCELCLGRTPW